MFGGHHWHWVTAVSIYWRGSLACRPMSPVLDSLTNIGCCNQQRHEHWVFKENAKRISKKNKRYKWIFTPKRKKRGTSGCTPKGNCNVGCFLIHGANTIKSNAEDWPSSWLNLDNFILAKRLVFFFSLFVSFIRVIHRYIRVWRIFLFFFYIYGGVHLLN